MKKIYVIMFSVSMMMMAGSVVLVSIYGLNLGVDFKGGSAIEIDFQNVRPDITSIKNSLLSDFPGIEISPLGETGILIKTVELAEREHQKLLNKISTDFSSSVPQEEKFDSIGPVIGSELKKKSVSAIIAVLVLVVVYIALVFRKLSQSLSPWAMGAAAIAALIHDVIIPIGIFAYLGRHYGVEVGAVFVAALLTILGYSVSDTVVIFDRVRENIVKARMAVGNLGDVVHRSVIQTLARSVNTTLTTLLSLAAIYFFGGESIKFFSLALIIGIFLGGYSSIFIASPLLVWWTEKRTKK